MHFGSVSFYDVHIYVGTKDQNNQKRAEQNFETKYRKEELNTVDVRTGRECGQAHKK